MRTRVRAIAVGASLALWPCLAVFAALSPATAAPPEEVKLLIREDQIDRALRVLGLHGKDARERAIVFFDTPELALLSEGVILRARDPKDESTVKLRPAQPGKIPREMAREDGFKCERDRSPKDAKISCSLTVRQDDGEVESAAKGKRSPKKLFSKEQEAMARFGFGRALPWERLRVFGPIRSRDWKIDVKGFEEPVSLELWALSGGKRVLEVSTRTSDGKGERALKEIARWISARGLRVDPSSGAKTRVALDHLR